MTQVGLWRELSMGVCWCVLVCMGWPKRERERSEGRDGWCAGGVDRQLKEPSSSFPEPDITGREIRRL